MKKQQILNAATNLFMRFGFGVVTMDKVAQEARVSKATVYAHFSSKELLFAAILENYFEQSSIRMPQLTELDPQTMEQLEVILYQFLRDVHDYYTNPAVVKLYRLLIGEVNQFPEIFDWVFGKHSSQTTKRLAEFLWASKLFGFSNEHLAYLTSCKIMDMLRGVTLWPQLVNNYHKFALYPDSESLLTDIFQYALILLKLTTK